MSKIPTAKEFIEEFITLHSKQNKNLSDDDMMELVANNYKEFAKLHVKAALETASENAVAEIELCRNDDEYLIVNKQSILSAYPEENIK